MVMAEFKCEGCGVHITTFRVWNFRTIPPSMDMRDLCMDCKREEPTCISIPDKDEVLANGTD